VVLVSIAFGAVARLDKKDGTFSFLN